MLNINFINWSFLQEILLTVSAALIAIIIHEFSHGFVAYLFGDKTAKDNGRLSLNPLKHIDPIGAICLIFFKFGWAKPVPINPYFFKNRRLGTISVSLAGAFSNFLLTVVSLFVFCSTNKLLIENNAVYIIEKLSFMDEFWIMLAQINIGLCIFNLLPIPPLDGSKLLAQFLPLKAKIKFLSFERYGSIILFIALYFLRLSSYLSVAINYVFYNLLKGISQIFI